MTGLKGSRTEVNLLTAFAGESQARNRYTYFASAAKNDGYILVQNIFLETAEQEKEHAKRLFKFLEGGDAVVNAAFPAGIIACTADNLLASIAGEDEEWQEMYPSFAAIAKEEGFNEIACHMLAIAEAEKHHSQRYSYLRNLILEQKMFSDDTPQIWQCQNCGYVGVGNNAPDKCPACDHPQMHFKRGTKY